jgi:hypothetical protein
MQTNVTRLPMRRGPIARIAIAVLTIAIRTTRWVYAAQANVALKVLGTFGGVLYYLLYRVGGRAAMVALMNESLMPAGYRVIDTDEYMDQLTDALAAEAATSTAPTERN